MRIITINDSWLISLAYHKETERLLVRNLAYGWILYQPVPPNILAEIIASNTPASKYLGSIDDYFGWYCKQKNLLYAAVGSPGFGVVVEQKKE